MRGAASVAALGALPEPLLPQSLLPQSGGGARFAYVGCGDDALCVFRLRGEQWTLIQRVASRAPSSLVLSAAERTLYVANEIEEHEGLPRGTVERFRVEPEGRLALMERVALSLSASFPRQMALSPDGQFLAVAAYGGGIYNLIAMAADGSMGAIRSIFKDTGSGPYLSQSSAHPHSLVFDCTGQHLLTSDFGSDRLSIFSTGGGKLVRCGYGSSGEGSGPASLVLHPSGLFVYVWHGLEGMLVGYRRDGQALGEPVVRVPAAAGGLAMHPSGRMLYSAEGAWRIDSARGTLTRARWPIAGGNEVAVSRDGTRVYILDGARGWIHEAKVERANGEVHSNTNVAVVERPRCIAVKTS